MTLPTENSHGVALDGKSVIKPTPFDAHEQATRGVHVPTELDSPDKDPATVQEFPKAVDHVDHPSGVGLQPVVVKDAAAEKTYLDSKAEAVEVEPEEPADPKPADDPGKGGSSDGAQE